MRRSDIIGDGGLAYRDKGKMKYHKHWSYHLYATFPHAGSAYEFVRLMEYAEAEGR
jgi:hypothetical protein